MLEASTLFILTLGGVGLNEIPNFFLLGRETCIRFGLLNKFKPFFKQSRTYIDLESRKLQSTACCSFWSILLSNRYFYPTEKPKTCRSLVFKTISYLHSLSGAGLFEFFLEVMMKPMKFWVPWMQAASSVLKTAISEQQRDSFCFKACDARCSIKGRTHKVKHTINVLLT